MASPRLAPDILTDEEMSFEAPLILTDKEISGITTDVKRLYASMETSGDISDDYLQLEPSTFEDLKRRKKIRQNITTEDLKKPEVYDEVASGYIQDLKDTFGIPTDEEVALWSWRPSWYKKYGGKIENIPEDAPGVKGKSGRQVMQDRYNNMMGYKNAPDILTDDEMQDFDPEGEGYDYETAYKYGLQPDETGHWPSRVPQTGQILKGKKHKTWGLTEQGEKEAGYKIEKRDDRYYSTKIAPDILSDEEMQGKDPRLDPTYKERGLGEAFKYGISRIKQETAKESDVIGSLKVFGEVLKRTPKETALAVLRAHQGAEGASVVDKDWAQRTLREAHADSDKFVSDIINKYKETRIAPGVPIKISDVAQLPQNLAYSLTSMGAGLATGLPIAAIPLPGARVAAWATGTAASGKVAYEMSTYEIMQEYLEAMNEKEIAETGKPITPEKEKQLKKDFNAEATKYGLWEAVPEALSNLAFAKLLTIPLTKMVGKGIAGRIVTRLSGIYGEELLTETITQKGQAPIEYKAGLREEKGLSWEQAFKEVAPQTFLLTTILAGTGATAIKAKEKIMQSLKNELGVGHLLYEDLKEKLTSEAGFARIGKDEEGEPIKPVSPEAPKPAEIPEIDIYSDVEAIKKAKKKIKPVDVTTDEGQRVLEAYEKQKDLWFGKKDMRIFKTGIEKKELQGKIKTALKERKYTERVKDYDKAIQLYIDTKRNPAHIEQYADKLTPEQTKILTLSQNLPTNLKVVADEIAESYKTLGLEALDHDVIRNVSDNYAARIWDIGGKKGVEAMRKFGTTTRHAKARKFETIIEGWANEFKLKVEGASSNLAILKEEIIKTIEDKKFIKAVQKLKTMEGNPLLTTQQLEGYKQVEHPNFKMWKYAGKAEKGKVYGRNFFMDDKGNLFERRSLYAPESIAKNMNNILGVSRLNEIEWIKAITRFNADTKAWILQSSFFHHMAFMRSYWFGTQSKKWSELSPRQAYRQGLEAIAQGSPLIELGVKNGLTLGLKQDWNEELLRQRTKLGQMFDKMGIATTIRDKIFALRQQQADFLFGKFGAGLKAKAFLIEYRNMLRKHPEMMADERAKAVANLVNDDFGGLHLQRMGRNPTVQHIFRLLALAPDWTESNVRTMVKAFKASGKEETDLYRKFWAGVFTKGMGLTVMANALMAGFDEDDRDAQGAWQRFVRNYRIMWKQGNLRYLDVDVTPLYRALGGKTKERKYFSILGHFKDPIKFILHPIRSAHHKGSVIYKFFHEALAGVDWARRRFTTVPEFVGLDIGKGRYKTTRRGKYAKGDPKWGKLKWQTVTWTPGERGPVSYKQLPSFIINQIKGWQPIQIQNLLGWLAGEMEGFDALTKSMGLRTATTYGLEEEEKKISKGLRWKKKKSKSGRWK